MDIIQIFKDIGIENIRGINVNNCELDIYFVDDLEIINIKFKNKTELLEALNNIKKIYLGEMEQLCFQTFKQVKKRITKKLKFIILKTLIVFVASLATATLLSTILILDKIFYVIAFLGFGVATGVIIDNIYTLILHKRWYSQTKVNNFNNYENFSKYIDEKIAELQLSITIEKTNQMLVDWNKKATYHEVGESELKHDKGQMTL